MILLVRHECDTVELEYALENREARGLMGAEQRKGGAEREAQLPRVLSWKLLHLLSLFSGLPLRPLARPLLGQAPKDPSVGLKSDSCHCSLL